MRRSGRPPEPGEHILVEAAFDGQIAWHSSVCRQIASRPLDACDHSSQAGGRSFALCDLDVCARESALHEIGTALRNPDIALDTAPGKTAEDGERQGSRPLSKASHAADTAQWRDEFQTNRRRSGIGGASAAANLGVSR
jgi:hypothetical protein